MSVKCETCGESLSSHGSYNLHQYVKHADPVADEAFASEHEERPAPVAHAARVRTPHADRPPTHALLAAIIAVLLAGVISAFVVDPGSDSGTQLTATQAGGSGTEAAPGTPGVPEGYQAVDRSDDGFVIAMPGRFVEENVTRADVDEAIEALEGAGVNSSLLQVMRSTRSNLKNARFFAIDPVTGSNVNVMRVVMGDDSISVDDIPVYQLLDFYTRVGLQVTGQEKVHLPGGDALKVTATFDLAGETVYATQHMFLSDGELWLITYTQAAGTPTADADTVAATFRTVD